MTTPPSGNSPDAGLIEKDEKPPVSVFPATKHQEQNCRPFGYLPPFPGIAPQYRHLFN
jgi:hypothetical protein